MSAVKTAEILEFEAALSRHDRLQQLDSTSAEISAERSHRLELQLERVVPAPVRRAGEEPAAGPVRRRERLRSSYLAGYTYITYRPRARKRPRGKAQRAGARPPALLKARPPALGCETHTSAERPDF